MNKIKRAYSHSRGGSGISQTLISSMLNLGGTWSNTGYGFESSDNIGLGYDGSYTSLNTLLDSFINIPEIVLSGNSLGWGSQAQGSFNAFMNSWNGNNKGSFWNFSANFAFGGGVGFSIGQVTDSNNETDWFFSLNGNLGLSAGAGFERGLITPTDPAHRFINSDFTGDGRTISGGEGFLSGTIGGTFSHTESPTAIDRFNDQFNPGNFGRNSKDFKAGYTTSSLGPVTGVKGGFPIMWSATKTWVRGK